MRTLKLTVLALLLATIAAALIYGNWVAAQARAVVVLSTTIETPALTWFVKVVTDEPRWEETVVAGASTTIVRPGGGKRWPAVVFVNGATRVGRYHPKVRRLAGGLARAGFVVLVPDLPGLALGEIDERTVSGTLEVALAAANRPDAKDGRVGFVGVSVGTSLALLAAERPRLAPRVSVVAGLGGYTDLRKVTRLATTGSYPARSGSARYAVDPYLGLSVARSLAAGLAQGRDRRSLVGALEAVGDADPDPLALLQDPRWERLSAPAHRLVELLVNRDPARFPSLYRALSPSMRSRIARLSPVTHARRLRAPVLVAADPHDDYFPVQEVRALRAAAPQTDVQVTVTEAISHVDPRPTPGNIADLLRFDGFVVRVLERAWD